MKPIIERTRRSGVMALLPLLALLLAMTPGDAKAQLWTGSVVDGATGAPVGGAFVSLAIEGGTAARQVLTGEDGRFAVPAPGGLARSGSTWTVTVQMLGYANLVRTGVVTGQGVEHLDFALVPRPLVLDGIEAAARSDRQCSPLRPDDGTLLAMLWEEARKSIERAAWGQGDGGYRFIVRNYEREINPTTRGVIAERTGEEINATRPFESPSAAELNRLGWARWDPPGSRGGFVVYDGPDPEALLSDEFHATHCFSVRLSRDRPDQVGIAFAPEHPDPARVGISGVVWLDRESGMLKSLSYTYTSHPGFSDAPDGVLLPDLVRLQLGSEIRFRTFPRGEVVVDRWHIRMPLQTARGVFIREQGGVLLRAITPRGRIEGFDGGGG